MTTRWLVVGAAAAAISMVCLVRVAVTSSYEGPTYDEGAHIAGGYDALNGIPPVEIEHPPLARAIFAWPLRHLPNPAIHDTWGFQRGRALLSSGDYMANLVRARRGNLIFLLVLLASVFFWTLREFGDIAALIALTLVSTLPPILAHASLATTDLPVTAMLPAALLATIVWLERPTGARTLLLGCAIGIGLLVKFSFPVFYGLGVVIVLLRQSPKRQLLRPAFVAAGLAALIVWAGYRFEFGTLAAAHPQGAELARLAGYAPAASLPIPAPLYLGGLIEVKLHNDRGADAYLFGTWTPEGRWYYFPAVLLFETPLPFLILSIAGAMMLFRSERWMYAALPLAVLVPAMFSRMNLGVRHVLPMYPLLALLAAFAVVSMKRWIAVALVAWQLVTTSLAHPNYLGWMNALARGHPERIALGSNLDWGQDTLPLARACHALGVQRIGLMVVSTANLDAIGMPPSYPLDARTPAHGWVAVSIDPLTKQRSEDARNFAWLAGAKRSIRIGRSITLYDMP